ncbi:MAG: HlyC/CorC family transporter [Candidatus Solibacter usitatus]|nr:HlyC/CorC family transporter [Candidatus Solibacter usitatus]
MTILLIAILIGLSGLVIAVSFIHLLCRESLHIHARELPSLEFFKDTLQEKLGMEPEDGALAYSLVRHFGLLALAIVTLAVTLSPQRAEWLALLEAFLFSSALMLFTSYLAPRFLYRRTGGRFTLAFLPVLRLLAIAVRPVIALLDMLQSIAELGGEHRRSEEKPTTEEHIEALIEAGMEEGILEDTDSELIQSVVAFGDKTVREVMTPRPNIVAIAAGASLEELRDLVIHEQYSRVPVYEGSVDNLVGFVHVRDMFELDPEERAGKQVRSMQRPLRCVPETKPVSDLLREMQRESVHMVGVVDEYGGTAGIATMEDLVEEIIGEVRDEHEPGIDAEPEAGGAYVVAGNYDLDHLRQLLDFTPEEETEATTVGGLMTEWLGRVPKPGEAAERGGIRLEVIASDDRRVEKLRIRKAQEQTT